MRVLAFHQSEDFPRLIEQRFDANGIRGERIAGQFREYENQHAEKNLLGMMILKYLLHLSEKGQEKLEMREDIFWAEVFGRYLRFVLREVFDGENKIPAVNIKNYWDGLRRNECVEANSFTATLQDLTRTRIFFAQEDVAERPEGETLWELYKAYDKDGKRRMHLGSFHTLLPKVWREKYQKIDTPYDDCVSAEEWFKEKKLAGRPEGETLWELYKTYDKDGKRRMHLGHFHTLLPKVWREKYQYVAASYDDCVAAEEWFKEKKLTERPEGETLWELYKAYLETTERTFERLSFFHLILPSHWRIAYPYSGENENNIEICEMK